MLCAFSQNQTIFSEQTALVIASTNATLSGCLAMRVAFVNALYKTREAQFATMLHGFSPPRVLVAKVIEASHFATRSACVAMRVAFVKPVSRPREGHFATMLHA